MRSFSRAALAALILAAPAAAAAAPPPSPSPSAARQDEIRRDAEGGKLPEALSAADALCASLEKAPPAERADALRLKAHVQRLQKDDAGAAATLEQAEALSPDDAATLSALAEAQAALGREKEALGAMKRLEKAVRRRSERDADSARAEVLVQRASIQTRLGEARGARKTLETAAELAPDSSAALADLAQAELADGRARQALDAARRWEKAAEAEPSERRAQALAAQGRALEALKDAAGARKAFERAVDLTPSDRGALEDLARLQAGAGDTRAALETLSRVEPLLARDSAPRRADLYRRLARLHAAAGDDAQARADAARALALQPGDVQTLFVAVEGSTAAARSLALVEANEPQDGKDRALWLAIRGLARAKTKDDAGAKQDFAAAVAADGKGVCFGAPLSREPDTLAPAFYDACLAAFPNDASLYASRGVARFLAGLKDDAVVDFSKSVELKPSEPGGWLSLLSALVSEGRTSDALAAAEKAVSAVKDRGSREYKELLAQRETLRQAAPAAAPNGKP